MEFWRDLGLSPRTKKLLRIPLLMLSVSLVGAAWLWFGDSGFVRLYRTETERQDCLDRIHRLAAENEGLFEEIERLRTDMNYLESVARRELNFIKENEVIYRFESPGKAPPPASEGMERVGAHHGGT